MQAKSKRRHGELLPNNIRGIFCGPSNCGKTNALLTLITNPSGLKFENICLLNITRTAQILISQAPFGAYK